MKSRLFILLVLVLSIVACSDDDSNGQSSIFEGVWLEAANIDLYTAKDDVGYLCVLGSRGVDNSIFRLEARRINSKGGVEYGEFDLVQATFLANGSRDQVSNKGFLRNEVSLEEDYKDQWNISPNDSNRFIGGSKSTKSSGYAKEFIKLSDSQILKIKEATRSCNDKDYDEAVKPGDTIDIDEDIKEDFLETVSGEYESDKAPYSSEVYAFNDETFKETGFEQLLLVIQGLEHSPEQLFNNPHLYRDKSPQVYCGGLAEYTIVHVKKRKYMDQKVIFNGAQDHRDNQENSYYMVLQPNSLDIESIKAEYYGENYKKFVIPDADLKRDEILKVCTSQFLKDPKISFFKFYSNSEYVEGRREMGEDIYFPEIIFKKKN